MSESEHTPMEELDVFRQFVGVADWAWEVVAKWPPFARDTIGKQLVRAADSVGANLVEGDGRYSVPDGLHFFVMARASARETRYWIQRAVKRNLVTAADGEAQIAALTLATRSLNSLISYRRKYKPPHQVKESEFPYSAEGD